MESIRITFDVLDVDPRLVDPHDIAEYLFGLYDIERRTGNTPFQLGENFLTAEWEE